MVVSLLLCAVAAAASKPTQHDLLRASSMPGSSYRGDDFAQMASVLNSHLERTVSSRPCAEFTLSELREIEKTLLQLKSPELQAIYISTGDRRQLSDAQLGLEEETAHPQEMESVVRDGKCHQVVMLYVHHLSEGDKDQIAQLFTLPLLSLKEHHFSENSSSAKKAWSDYRSSVSCTSCHTSVKSKNSTFATLGNSTTKENGPEPPIWGGVLAWSAHVNMTNPSDSPEAPDWTFQYYYDASQDWTVTRYDFDADQHDEVCKMVKNKKGRCSVVHATDKWMYLMFPDDDRYCCKCTQSIGAVRHDWLAEGATFQGNTTIAGVIVGEWLKYGASDNHYYATTDETQRPVRYMEHKNGKLKQWDFISFTPGAQNRSMFAPPCSNRCESLACLA